MLKDLVLRSRSYRRFEESVPVTLEQLMALADLARFAPSASNLQALKFGLVSGADTRTAVFSCLKFASYLSDWAGPEPGERPSAYIIIFGDQHIKKQFDIDAGIAAQTIMLGAADMDLGGCILASVNRERLRESLDLPAHLEVILVLALGKPAETVVLEPVSEAHGIRYYRDQAGVHHVPKRALEDLVLVFNN